MVWIAGSGDRLPPRRRTWKIGYISGISGERRSGHGGDRVVLGVTDRRTIATLLRGMLGETV
ncbi:hypothetical protein OHS58_03550 [Amycolatopsis sp. NBC_00348]|uniref:hypothetical protein n=1 Tax=Amycolatopsis sp. NBC_00348 TaxID=2975956 RepID=UPI002E271B3E